MILLDDTKEIMVIPHSTRVVKWLTYDQIDEKRKQWPRLTEMLYQYNEIEGWAKRAKLRLRRLESEQSNRKDL